jgi:hypothetical protein
VGVLRRTLTVAVALLCAATLAFIALPIAVILDPVLRGIDPGWFAYGLLAVILLGGDPDRLATSVLFVWTAMITVCFLPLVVTALAGEAARLRSWLWYAVATGLVAAGLPLAIRAGLGTAPLRQGPDVATAAAESRLLLLFFLTGVVSGSLYWLMAGRHAGEAAALRSRSAP